VLPLAHAVLTWFSFDVFHEWCCCGSGWHVAWFSFDVFHEWCCCVVVQFRRISRMVLLCCGSVSTYFTHGVEACWFSFDVFHEWCYLTWFSLRPSWTGWYSEVQQTAHTGPDWSLARRSKFSTSPCARTRAHGWKVATHNLRRPMWTMWFVGRYARTERLQRSHKQGYLSVLQYDYI